MSNLEYSSIFDRFKSLAELENSEAEKWSYLIYDCMVEIRNMLLPDCDIEKNCHRLTAVTAALVFYRYKTVLAARGTEPKSFKAGDVTLEIGDSAVKSAYMMYREELSGIGDILKINDFVFGRTESLCTKN